MDDQNIIRSNYNSSEVGLPYFMNIIWKHRILFIKWIGLSFIVGLIFAFSTPLEYKTRTTMLALNENYSILSGLLQQFGGIAGMGLNLKEEEDALSPSIYPEIARSTPFLLQLMQQNFYFAKPDTVVSLYTYLYKFKPNSFLSVLLKYSVGLPGQIKEWLRKKPIGTEITNFSGIIQTTCNEEKVMQELKKRILINYNNKTNILTLNIEMPDASVSALLSDTVVKLLSSYICDYRTQKVRHDLEFISNQYSEARRNFEIAQINLALFRDENKDISSALAKTKEEQLKAEFNLAFNVYNGLSQQLEEAKIRVQERKPVFKIIEPPKIPVKPVPIRKVILIFSIFIGIFVACLILFFRARNSLSINPESNTKISL